MGPKPATDWVSHTGHRPSWFEPWVQNRPPTHYQNPISGSRKGHSRFLERLWYPTLFDFFKPPDKLVSGFDGVGPDPCIDHRAVATG